eukprot:COSAG03_NODE_4210_length_1638_cov_1.263158_4_plen_48_part_01
MLGPNARAYVCAHHGWREDALQANLHFLDLKERAARCKSGNEELDLAD